MRQLARQNWQDRAGETELERQLATEMARQNWRDRAGETRMMWNAFHSINLADNSHDEWNPLHLYIPRARHQRDFKKGWKYVEHQSREDKVDTSKVERWKYHSKYFN